MVGIPTDPGSMAAQELIKQAGSQSGGQSGSIGLENSGFDKVMQGQNSVQNVQGPTQVTGANQVDQANPVNQASSATPANKVNAADKVDQANITSRKPVPATTAQGGLKGLLGQWGNDQNAMGKIMQVATSGQQLSPQQLVVLQAATYKVTFEMNTFSKFAETASNAVKTTMQTQV